MENPDPTNPDQTDPNAPAPGAQPPAGFGNPIYDQIGQFFTQATNGKFTPTLQDVSQWGTNVDANYLNTIRNQIYNVWAPQWLQSNQTTTTPAASTGGAGSSSGSIDLNAPLVKQYDQPFTPPAMLNLGGPAGLSYIPPAPSFNFKAPSVEDALNEPGYQFGVQQGDAGIQNWAASRGMLNDPTTARTLSDYNRNAAQQDYASVWNRAFQSQGAAFQPLYGSWQTLASAGQHQNDMNYANAWNLWLAKLNDYNNWQDRAFNKETTLATA